MTKKELNSYAIEMGKANPNLLNQINSFAELAFSEIEEGGNEQTECLRAKRDIEELIAESEAEKRGISSEDVPMNGYTNHETYLMISHIHNNQQWLEESFEIIRQKSNAHILMIHFHDKIFKGKELKDLLGRITFQNIDWNQILVNLKELMPKIRFEVGDYLTIVDGDDLTFDWKGKVFVFDSYDGNPSGAINIADHSREDVEHYELFEHRFAKVTQNWRFVEESDRWISEWTDEKNKIVGVNYFQGKDSFDELHDEFFFPNVELTEKVLSKCRSIDDAIWFVIHEENMTKEELVERLDLANTQAKMLFDQLHSLGDGISKMAKELRHAHNIKLLTDLSTDEWKYQD